MSSYIGPNGRIYRRERRKGGWLALTVVCVMVVSLAIVAVPSIAGAFRYLGL
jgi:hypothetical protein